MDNQRASDSLAFNVLEAVAKRRGTAIEDLPPLGNAIDPDALDQLFSPRYDGARRHGGYVRFPYAGYMVTIESDGKVEISEK